MGKVLVVILVHELPPKADLVVQKVVAAVEVGSPVDHLAVDSGGVNNGSASLV